MIPVVWLGHICVCISWWTFGLFEGGSSFNFKFRGEEVRVLLLRSSPLIWEVALSRLVP